MKPFIEEVRAEFDSLKSERDALKTEIELLRLQVQSWKAEYDTLKHEVERLREQLKALREYVRNALVVVKELEHEAGGREQVNYRAGMKAAYRDIEKWLTEMEGKQV